MDCLIDLMAVYTCQRPKATWTSLNSDLIASNWDLRLCGWKHWSVRDGGGWSSLPTSPRTSNVS